ncbi:MAG: hypothetical protein M1831_004123, partial [Alyxoria varia]
AHRRELQGLRAQQNGEVDSSPGKTPVEEGGPTLKVQTQEMLLVAQQNEHSPNLDPPPKPAAAGPGIGKGKRPRPDAAADEDGEESPELKRLREPEEISEGELDRILDGLLGEVGEKQEEGEEDSTAESPLRDALDPSNHNRDSPGQAGDPGTETPALQFPKAVLPYVPQGIWMVRSRSLAPLGRYPSAETTIALLNRVSQKVFSIFQHRGPVATQVATYTLGEFSIRISFKNPFALIYPAVQHSLDTKIDPSQYLVKRPRFVQAQFDPPLVRVSRPGSDGPPGLRGYDYTASPSLRHWMEMQATSSVPSPRGSRRRMRNKDGMGGMFITTDGLFGFGYRIFRTEDGIPDDVPEDPSHIEQGGTNTAQHQEDPPNNGNDRISQATNGILIVEAPPDPEPQQGGFDIATPLPDESEVATQDGLAAAPLELDAESAVKPADPGNWEMLTLVQSLGVAPGILWYLIRTLSDKVPEPSQPNS